MFPQLTGADFHTMATVVVGILLVMLFIWATDKKGPKGRR